MQDRYVSSQIVFKSKHGFSWSHLTRLIWGRLYSWCHHKLIGTTKQVLYPPDFFRQQQHHCTIPVSIIKTLRSICERAGHLKMDAFLKV